MKKLNNLFIAGFALLLAFGCEQPEDEKKDIGIQLWSVKEAMNSDAAGTIQKLGEMGYTFVEPAGYSDGKFYNMQPAEFKKLVEDNGMRILSSHTGQALPDSAKWDETMAWWDEAIAAHKELGVTYLVQPFMGSAGYDSLAGLANYVDYFNTIGEKAQSAGIQFGYHNHAKEFNELEGQIIYDYMLENTDPEKVFFQLDLFWIKEGGKEAVKYFEKYPGRFKLWHVKDEAELGASGEMDFASVFAKKDQAGLEAIIVEVEEYNYEPIVSVEKSLEYLQTADFVE